MNLALLQSSRTKIFVAAVAAALLGCSAYLSWDIIHKRKQRAFFQADLEWHGGGFWKGRQWVEALTPSDSIPVQLPGPADDWAGGESKEIRIKAPFNFKTQFTIRFLESHESSPPLIEAWAGGAMVARFQVEKGTGYPRVHWPREGKTSRADFLVPTQALAEGTVITIKSVAGSWAALQGVSASGKPESWEYMAAVCSGALAAIFALALGLALVSQDKAGFRKAVFAAILALMGVTAGLAIGEVSFRVLDILPRPMNPLPANGFQLSDNPLMLFENKPNMRRGARGEDGSVEEYTTNSAGFRDVERKAEKEPGVYRIIVLGDSTTAGAGIGDTDALFTRMLESRLNQALAPARFEVLNMGVSGYQSIQEAELLRARGMKYQPDMVIMLFCHNDFQLNVDGNTYYNLLMANPDFKARQGATSMLDLLIARSRLAFVVYHRLMAALEPPNHFDEIVNDYKEKYMGSKTTVEVALESLTALAQEKGFTPAIAILPLFDRPFDQYRHGYQHDRVKEIAARFTGLEVWDLMDGFARIDNQAGRFGWDGMHMNEAGHQAAAEILFEMIKPKLPAGAGRE